MGSFVPISEFESEIESYLRYDVSQKGTDEHIFLKASFTQAYVLLSSYPMLLFKNDVCEIHIHNIDKVFRIKSDANTTYILHCIGFSDGGKKHTHICSIICQ